MMTRRPRDRWTIRRWVFLSLILIPMAWSGSAAAQDARTHTVRAGDTLFRISREYNVTVEELRRLNAIVGNRILVGQVLRIPAPSGVPVDVRPPKADSSTVGAAAADSDAVEDPSVVPDSRTTDSLKATTSIPTADRIESKDDHPQDDGPVHQTAEAVAQRDSVPVETGPPIGYLEVLAGQSVYDLAFSTGLPADSLMALNPSLPTFLERGRRLAVPPRFASVQYRVRPGDTLFKIARQFETTVPSIRAANRIQGEAIKAGALLTIPSSRRPTDEVSELELPRAGSGIARLYPSRFAGRLTASGIPYDPEAFTISHRDLPIGSIVLITSTSDRQASTFALVNDRLPSSADYLIDISESVARMVVGTPKGNPEVEVRVVRFGPAR